MTIRQLSLELTVFPRSPKSKHLYKIFRLLLINWFKFLKNITKTNTVQVKEYITRGCIPPSAIRCDLWSLQMKAARDLGYLKDSLGHNLLIKIFSKLDHVPTKSHPEASSFGLLRDQNSQALRQVSPAKGTAGGTLYKQTGPSRLEVQIIFSLAALPNQTKVCRDYQYASPR